MPKKKILHISKYYPPYRGGIEDVCYNIVNGVNSVNQKVLCFNNSKQNHSSIENGIEVIRVGTITEFARQPISFSLYSTLKSIIKNYKPNIICLHLPNPLVCLYILLTIPKSIKLILYWHSDIVAQKYLYILFRGIEKRLLKRADVIIATSPNYLNHSKPLSPFQHKCTVVPNVVSLEKLKIDDQVSDKSRKLLSKYNNKDIIFFMGRHVEYKGIEYLLEAEKYITSDCIILIAGEGALTTKLKEKNNSDRIIFVGKIPDDEINIYMNAASIFAFPSITKNEAFGVVLAEAMYCKCVPVTFTIEGSGVNWVNINNLTGLEVENKNIKKYGEALDFLLKNKDLREEYAKAAHLRVISSFTISSIKMQIEDVYNKLMN